MTHVLTRPRPAVALVAGVLVAMTATVAITAGQSSATTSPCGAPAHLTVATNQNGRLEMFGTCGGQVLHRRQLTGMTSWSGWQQLGQLNLGNLAISRLLLGRNADGRLELFANVSDHGGWVSVQQAWQVKPNGAWSKWTTFPGTTGAPVGLNLSAVARNADGRLEVFSANASHAWQLTPGGKWSAWASTGEFGAEAVGTNADGRLEMFGLFQGHEWYVIHAWQLRQGGWSRWASLGSLYGGSGFSLTPALNSDGRLELFSGSPEVITREGSWWPGCYDIGHTWQVPASGNWAPWTALTNHCDATPVVAANADGRLEVFTQQWTNISPPFDSVALGILFHLWQQPQVGWSAETPLLTKPGASGSVAVARNGRGLLEAFVPFGDAIWHAGQLKPNSTGWSVWRPMP